VHATRVPSFRDSRSLVPMANASADFLWGALRDTSCYILKARQVGRSGMGKRGAEFTMEPNNVTSKNAFKYSGLCNEKTVALVPTEGGVVLTTKTKNSARKGKPATMYNKTTLTRDFRRVAKAISKNTAGNLYRADLEKAALAKWSLIYASQKKKAKK